MFLADASETPRLIDAALQRMSTPEHQ